MPSVRGAQHAPIGPFPDRCDHGALPDARLASFGIDDLKSIRHRKPMALHGIGLAVWDVIATRGEANPMAMAKHVDAQDPHLLSRISEHICKEVLFDIRYTKAERGKTPRITISEMLVARVYPNDLFVGDIEFSDPDKPIRKSERRFPMTKYAGLGLLGPFMAGVKACGKELGCESVRLVAATKDHVALFEQQGFRVADDSAIAERALAFGMSIPMRQKLDV